MELPIWRVYSSQILSIAGAGQALNVLSILMAFAHHGHTFFYVYQDLYQPVDESCRKKSILNYRTISAKIPYKTLNCLTVKKPKI